MQTEAGFLDAITSNPEDDAARLIYADWLEEQGDPRSEYLRLEVRYRQLLAQLAQIKGELKQLPAQLEAFGASIDQAWLDRVTPLKTVVLRSYPPTQKIAVIKLIREITGMGLKEAKDLSEALPATIKKGITRREAEHLRARFEPCGTVSIEVDPFRGDLATTEKRVVLRGYPPERKITVIKLIREITGCGLREAKDLSESLPATIRNRLTESEAEQIRQRFEEIATVTVGSAVPE